MFPADPRQLEHQPVMKRDQPYFEVLVVESMTEAQERALRKEVRSWRRPDDEFVYERVVVSSGDEAWIAARLNVNLQAVVIRRRLSHQSTCDLSSLTDFDQKVAEPFHEAYMAHTSTSPNYQILASLDLGRRQVALEGVELVQRQIENAMQLRDAIDNHPLLSKYMTCLRTSDLIPDQFRPSGIGQPLRSGLRNMMSAWDKDEFVLDPSRITLSIGRTGYDGDSSSASS